MRLTQGREEQMFEMVTEAPSGDVDGTPDLESQTDHGVVLPPANASGCGDEATALPADRLAMQTLLRIGAGIVNERSGDQFVVSVSKHEEECSEQWLGTFGPSFGDGRSWFSSSPVELLVAGVGDADKPEFVREVVWCLRQYAAAIERDGLPRES
jgi:hypothetical protein